MSVLNVTHGRSAGGQGRTAIHTFLQSSVTFMWSFNCSV